MPEELTVRIRTESLEQASVELGKKVGDLKKYFENMTEAMNRTNDYWLGEAGEAHREAYRRLMPRQEEVLRRLQEQVSSLAKIAGTWEAAEQEVKELDLSLPDDVIV